MDSVEKWLTTTIPGILILGTTGSIIAVVVVAGFNRALPKVRWMLFLRRYVLGLRINSGVYAHGYAVGQIGDDPGKVAAYYAYRLAVIVGSVGACVLCTIIFVALVSRPGTPLLTAGSYASLVVAIIAAASTLFHVALLRYSYNSVVPSLLEEGSQRYMTKELERVQTALSKVRSPSR